LHPLASGKWTEHESTNPVDSGEMWECPDFFALGSKHVLLYSTAGKVIWETGDLDPKELVFHSEKQGILDHGAYYAQKTQLDANGNRILWGWITEKRSDDQLRAAGWAGCMALPRILSIGDDGGLEMRFAAETRSIRGKGFALPKSGSPAERARALQNLQIKDLAGEIIWKIRAATPAKGSRATFTLADRSGTWFSVELENVDRSRSKLAVNGKSIEIPEDGKSAREFHLFLDGSVAELICDGKHAITTRIYRKPDGPLSLAGADMGYAEVTSLDAWQLVAISPDRLTS
jgi:beta-fructofuranosidase